MSAKDEPDKKAFFHPHVVGETAGGEDTAVPADDDSGFSDPFFEDGEEPDAAEPQRPPQPSQDLGRTIQPQPPTAADPQGELQQAREDAFDARQQLEKLQRRWRPSFPQFIVSLVIAGVIVAVLAGAFWLFRWNQERLANLPPDLYDIEDPIEDVDGDLIGWSKTIALDDASDWSAEPGTSETRGVYVVTLNTHELVSWTQKHGDDEADNETLGELWTWLETDKDREVWPEANARDLEICGNGDLIAWSKVVNSDGLARVSRTGIDGKTVKTIETVKGGAYWCVLENEDEESHRLVTRWFADAPTARIAPSQDDEAEEPELQFEEKVMIPAFRFDLKRGKRSD